MNNLKAKLKKQGGFTLIEMLIVVAIIAILIAIAIPMVNAALERAREATDSANERAAIGLAYVDIMANEDESVLLSSATNTAYYVVTNNQGSLEATKSGDSYGKGTEAGDIEDDHTGCWIKVTYHPTADTSADPKWDAGDVTTEWTKT